MSSTTENRDGRIREARRQAIELLERMTLEEKIGQMVMYPGEPADVGFDDLTLEQVATDVEAYRRKMEHLESLVTSGRIGSFVKVPGSAAAALLQEWAGRSRLGIPLLIGTDAIHGHTMYTAVATVFPTPISIAASFDPELARRIGEATSREMRATGYHWTFAPNVDVVRDQRWGRTGETFGEDPLLAGSLGAAMIRGLQGDYGRNGVLACAKHFVGSGEAFNGINGSEIDVSERKLMTHHFPPFRRCLDAGVLSVMAAHHAIDGIPCHAHRRYLKHLLCDEWGFDGVVVSDWMDVGRLHTSQRVAASFGEACELAVRAGIDVYMAGDRFYEAVLDAVRAGRIPAERIDEAARRILFVKFLFGLFDNHPPAASREHPVLRSPEHRSLAREAARESLVLVANDRDLLPLRGEPKRVLVTGPLAHSLEILGDWVKRVQQRGVDTVGEAIDRGKPAGWVVEHAECGSVLGIDDDAIADTCLRAAEADIVVVCVGENSFRWSSEPKTSGENCDRASLDLPGRQDELVVRLSETGTPVVAVVITSRANSITSIAGRVPAILFAWEPGMFTGEAITDALFGRYSPSGRLPISIPRSSGHLQCVYDRPPLRLAKYGDSPETALFGFGHGLSYSVIEYRAIDHARLITVGEDLTVGVDVVNSGSLPTDHIVLIFLRDLVSSVTVPERKLVAFTRVRALSPGEARRVVVPVESEMMSLIDGEGVSRIEPGWFELEIGEDVTRFEVAGERP